LVSLCLGGEGVSADLKTIAAEPDPAKRARLALTNGERATTQAGDKCRASDFEACTALLAEVRESVELALQSLQATGVDPARRPGRYKEAEIQTRRILHLLVDLKTYIHPEDEADYESVRRRVSDINDRLLSAIMGKKKPRPKKK